MLTLVVSTYFPMQKEEKMAPSTSSVSTTPVISPRCVRASLSSRAVNSGLSWREMDSEASRTCSRQRPSSCWCRALMATRELPVSPGREEEKAWIMASSNSFLPSPVAQENRMPGTAFQSGWIPRSHLFRMSSRGAVRTGAGKSLIRGVEASATSRTRSAVSSALLVRVMPACSMTSEDSRTPAVSISRRASPAS